MDSQPLADKTDKPTLATLFARALRLRCPACGQTKLFRNRLSMYDRCEACGRKFDRAPGYLLGSIYFNYGITALLVIVFFFSMFLSQAMSGKALLIVLSLFILLFPIWFFRYARAMWIAFDEKFDPWPNEQEAREMAKNKQRPEA
ncbi:MAG: DUF983 domain-containing protein [Planctomycetes bacterium]|nr:DUF983 domain-containing protein [Planctomycetota bacterium]